MILPDFSASLRIAELINSKIPNDKQVPESTRVTHPPIDFDIPGPQQYLVSRSSSRQTTLSIGRSSSRVTDLEQMVAKKGSVPAPNMYFNPVSCERKLDFFEMTKLEIEHPVRYHQELFKQQMLNKGRSFVKPQSFRWSSSNLDEEVRQLGPGRYNIKESSQRATSARLQTAFPRLRDTTRSKDLGIAKIELGQYKKIGVKDFCGLLEKIRR